MNTYKQIIPFCKIRNGGGAYKNGKTYTNRINFIISLLKSLGIEYEVDTFQKDRFKDNNFYNIILKGSSNKWVMAHHDIANPKVDNANDNSCSVINAIALKKLIPSVNVILVDGEEPPCMGVGSSHFAEKVNEGVYGDVKWVLNLELTGKGGKNFFVSNMDTKLTNQISELFDASKVPTPFNDAYIISKYSIDTANINPCDLKENGELDMSLLNNCHTERDSIDTISVSDMKEFTEEVLVDIVNKL